MSFRSLFLIVAITATFLAGGFENVLSFQGKLVEGGAPVDGARNLTFRLYNTAVGGTHLWEESHFAVPVVGGLFNVELGGTTSFSGSGVNFDRQYWVGISVSGGPEITPRYKLTASGYAINIADTIRKVATQVFEGSYSDAIQITSPGFAGIYIEDATYNGIDVYGAGNHGFYSYSATNDGFYSSSSGKVAFRAYQPSSHAFFAINPDSAGMIIRYPGTVGVQIEGSASSGAGIRIMDPIGVGDPDTGIVIRDVATKGIAIRSPGEEGIWITNPAYDGIGIYNPGEYGLYIYNPGISGVHVENASVGIGVRCNTSTGRGMYIYGGTMGDPDTGIVVRNAGHYGIIVKNTAVQGMRVENPGSFGMTVYNTGHHGIGVENAGEVGVYVYRSDGRGFVADDPMGHGVDVISPAGDCYVCDGSPYRRFRVSNTGDIYGHNHYSYITNSEGKGVVAPIPRATSNWLEHIGEAKLTEGSCSVSLPKEFLAGVSITADSPIQVFLTPYGDLGRYTIERNKTGFIVRQIEGNPSADFSYRVVGKIRGVENEGIEFIEIKEEERGGYK